MPKVTVYLAYNNDGDWGFGDNADEAVENYGCSFNGAYQTIELTLDLPGVRPAIQVSGTVDYDGEPGTYRLKLATEPEPPVKSEPDFRSGRW